MWESAALSNSSYFAELRSAMFMLAEQPNTVFLGQGVGNPGTTMSPSFEGIAASKLLEMPVAEELQMGMAIGMALGGLLPICVFPRWNFMLRAADQIVNHLDRIPIYSGGGYKPKVIIRTAIPSNSPFNPGPQHDDDFSEAFGKMLRTVKVIRMPEPESIRPAYRRALRDDCRPILIEFTDRYKNQRANVVQSKELCGND